MARRDQIAVDLPDTCSVSLSRTFAARASTLFDAFTVPEQLKRWMTGPPGCTLPVCEIDLREGGGLRLLWRDRAGRELGMSGTYRSVERPNRLRHTERFDDEPDQEAVVSYRFIDLDHALCRLDYLHTFPSMRIRDRAIRGGMLEGLAASYESLAALLAERAE